MPCYNGLILVSPKGIIYWISNSYLGSVSNGMITNFEESKRIWKIFEKDEYVEVAENTEKKISIKLYHNKC